MKIESFNENIVFNDERVTTSVVLESSFSKEIRVLLKKGQAMKEHKTAYPIVVHLLKGELDFGVEGVVSPLKEGDAIALVGNIPHNLIAKTDSIVRLTLSKHDKAERVEEVAKTS